ncbi:MAG: arylsulfatase, partial [Novosphingobium sp.]|nr:arylsulfatase [Novosphingobium sp.]
GIPESSLPRTFNRSWTVNANVNLGERATGVIAAVGGNNSGWSLYLDEKSCPTFVHRLYSMEPLTLKCAAPLAAGQHRITASLDHGGSDGAKPSTLKLEIDGATVGQGSVEYASPALYTIDETFDVGMDRGAPAGFYPRGSDLGFPFAGGKIEDVTVSTP